MRVKRYIVLLLLLYGAGSARAQETRTEFSVLFRVGSATVESSFADNSRQLSDMIDFLQAVRQDESLEVTGVSFCGTTSLEGSYQLNRALAHKRLSALEQIVRGRVDIPESLITRDDNYIPWGELRRWAQDNPDLPRKSEVLAIIDEASEMVPYAGGATIDSRVLKLKELDGGSVWEQLNRNFFAEMRSASAVIVTCREEVPAPAPAEVRIDEPVNETPAPVEEAPVAEEPAPAAEPVAETVPVVETVETEGFVRRAYLKTDVLGWISSNANIAGEIDLCEHWSAALPIYYSGVNHYVDNLKFRLFGIFPEIRFWPSAKNDGLFLGGHLGMAYYNFAFAGDYRYQDHDGKTPALGGGVSIGYRRPISRDKRWRIEFTLGGGVYKLHYDLFENVPGGLLTGSEKKTYIGPDQVAVTFSYSFDMKKGGKK